MRVETTETTKEIMASAEGRKQLRRALEVGTDIMVGKKCYKPIPLSSIKGQVIPEPVPQKHQDALKFKPTLILSITALALGAAILICRSPATGCFAADQLQPTRPSQSVLPEWKKQGSVPE